MNSLKIRFIVLYVVLGSGGIGLLGYPAAIFPMTLNLNAVMVQLIAGLITGIVFSPFLVRKVLANIETRAVPPLAWGISTGLIAGFFNSILLGSYYLILLGLSGTDHAGISDTILSISKSLLRFYWHDSWIGGLIGAVCGAYYGLFVELSLRRRYSKPAETAPLEIANSEKSRLKRLIDYISSIALELAVLTGGLIICALYNFWPIFNAFLFLMFIPIYGALLLLLISAIASVIKLASGIKKEGLSGAIPFGINLLTAMIIVWYTPLSDLWMTANYPLYKTGRAEVVKQIEEDKLKSEGENRALIQLPDYFPILSSGGNDVLFEPKGKEFYVLFFTFRGILASYAGYLYVPDGGDPAEFAEMKGDYFFIIDPVAPNWFWVSSRN